MGECFSHNSCSFQMKSLTHRLSSPLDCLQLGVYHEGSIRLVKCSSNYSKHVHNIQLVSDEDDDENASLAKLRSNVRMGVWFHFAKFYIILMPFYCGVQAATIPVSIMSGFVSGFILMWCIFGKS